MAVARNGYRKAKFQQPGLLFVNTVTGCTFDNSRETWGAPGLIVGCLTRAARVSSPRLVSDGRKGALSAAGSLGRHLFRSATSGRSSRPRACPRCTAT